MGMQDFVLVNHTGSAIRHLYVSPADSYSWGEDILGRDILGDEEYVEVSFSRYEDADLWDIKIIDDEDEEAIWEDIDLSEISRITLGYDRNGDCVAECD